MSNPHAEAASAPGRPEELCSCGQALHYTDPKNEDLVRALIDQLGPNLLVRVPAGAWRVPRHYLALHGLRAAELPDLARMYGWPQLSGPRPAASAGRS